MAKPAKGPPQELLVSVLDYDPETGIFTRKVRCGRIAAGVVAGCLRPDGYLKISVGNKGYLAHRLAWQYVTGQSPSEEVDHINGDKTDNSFENLRAVSRRTNQENWLRPRRDKRTCPFLGVSVKNGRFVAAITIDRQTYHIGSFDTGEEAHEAYLQEKRKHHAGCTI